MSSSRSRFHPKELPIVRRLARAYRLYLGRHYGLVRPAWWPARWWPGQASLLARAGWLGPEHPYAGKQIELKAGGHVYRFRPVAYGPYRGHMGNSYRPAHVATLASYLAECGGAADAAPILAAVSALEGGFDSIQTYDRTKFCWGFIQFAGTGGLAGVLQQLKDDEPTAFAAYFARHGVDVRQGRLQVGSAVGGVALNRLHDDPKLWKQFLLAAADPVVQRVQVKAAYARYYQWMLARTARVRGVEYSYGEILAHHRFGRAIVFDRAVQRGVFYTARLLQQALAQAAAHGTPDADGLIAAARRLEPPIYHGRWDQLQALLDEKLDEAVAQSGAHGHDEKRTDDALLHNRHDPDRLRNF